MASKRTKQFLRRAIVALDLDIRGHRECAVEFREGRPGYTARGVVDPGEAEAHEATADRRQTLRDAFATYRDLADSMTDRQLERGGLDMDVLRHWALKVPASAGQERG